MKKNIFQSHRKNENITVILVPQNFSHQIGGKQLIKVSDPRKSFYLFYNFLLQFKERKNTEISQSAIISNSARIAKNNVKIGERSIIGENVGTECASNIYVLTP